MTSVRPPARKCVGKRGLECGQLCFSVFVCLFVAVVAVCVCVCVRVRVCACVCV